MTKEEKKQYNREYRINNREKLNAAKRASRAANPEKARAVDRKRLLNDPSLRKKRVAQVRFYKTGCTPEMYSNLLMLQDNKCGICSRHSSEFTRSLAADHCHKTGKVRGLLCHLCNTSLGMLNDDIERLKSMITYLENKV